MWISLWIISSVCIWCILSDAASDYNQINNDGSFSFGLSNDDIGGHYHIASGDSNKIVRGRYGSRSPASGRIEETVYTAGPRGYRARGPQIHRKMDLSQYPRGPIGTPEDPLADPYEDPSYSFKFRASDHERSEDADSSGRVTGLYSYLDDIGERHTVRYAAGAGTGFEVLNSVPDSPASVGYRAPLYKAPAKTPGKMSVHRGPDGQYKFILSGPDQRRSETSGPDGIVRGSYSYLDDKGIQRTVQYIAGAGIGYRIVQNTVGRDTHLAPRPAIPELGIRHHESNDLADDGYLRTAESGLIRPKDKSSDDDDEYYDDRKGTNFQNNRGGSKVGGSGFGDLNRGGSSTSSGGRRGGVSTSAGGSAVGTGVASADRKQTGQNRGGDKHSTSQDGFEDDEGTNDDRKNFEDNRKTNTSRKNNNADRRKPGPSVDFDDEEEEFYDGPNRGSISTSSKGNRDKTSSAGGRTDQRKPSTTISRTDDGSYKKDYGNSGRKDNYLPRDEPEESHLNRPGNKKTNKDRDNFDYDYGNDFPTITTDRRRLENDRNKDWSLRGRDSTLIKNVGKWYVGLPPGASVRAHVQSIDLLPLGGRIPSPSEALRRDEIEVL